MKDIELSFGIENMSSNSQKLDLIFYALANDGSISNTKRIEVEKLCPMLLSN
jgi:hypothetical protein